MTVAEFDHEKRELCLWTGRGLVAADGPHSSGPDGGCPRIFARPLLDSSVFVGAIISVIIAEKVARMPGAPIVPKLWSIF